MDNVGDFIASVSLGYHCLALHLTALALPAPLTIRGLVNEREKFFLRYFFTFRRMVDVRRSAVYELH